MPLLYVQTFFARNSSQLAGKYANRLAFFKRLAVGLTMLAALAAAPAAHAQYFALAKPGYPLEFYDIDFSYLADPAKRISPVDAAHYIPLGIGPDSYLSFGGEFREQFWAQNNEAHGLKAPLKNTYDLQRVIADAYLHFDRHLAIFVQVGRFDQFDKLAPLGTADVNSGRLQQGFLELKENIGPAEVTTRVGRQEIMLGSGRFVWVNDSSNIRTTHDGAHVQINYPGVVSLDLVATRPVLSPPYDFFDTEQHSGTFAAIYASEPVLPQKILNVDEYYYYRRNLGAQYVGVTANEERDTIGGRLWGALGSLKYDGDFAYQFGNFNNKEISAFGTSTRVLYTFDALPLAPGLQMQASYFSGGNPNDRTVGTFSAPFPRPTMLNYVGLETLENVIEAYPAILISPTSNTSLRFGPQFLWRASVYDAVYISRTTPLTATMSANDRASYIGTNLITTGVWNINPNVSLFAEYLHEIPGPAITLAKGRGTDAGVVQLDINF